MDYTKYRPFPTLHKPGRKWPSRRITNAPLWCSVDLRDGNQALETPMNLAQKLEFFRFLVEIGFREIEIGFPAASETEFRFTRALIEGNLIPDGVIIQALTQSREHIIRRTFEALTGVEKSIVHLYNSTSALQRDVVFQKSKTEVTRLAVDGAKLIDRMARDIGKERFIFEYSPESFTGTEMEYAIEICGAVLDVWQPTPNNKVIINLPSTVEMSTPNVYADQIETICDRIQYRDSVIISLHAHNDRGTAVAATELALLAGAERVEGTLFGNGERTGNADILTLGMNLYSQGIDPGLDFSRLDEMVALYEKSTNLAVHPRHPYAGSLVYTAFSGSHQDAINKGLARMKEKSDVWAVPYLPIDPRDVGRSYDPVIRINSQSGKGGVAYILEQTYGIQMPRGMQKHFGALVTELSDHNGKELSPEEIFDYFKEEYVRKSPMNLLRYNEKTNGETQIEARMMINGAEKDIVGTGNGIMDAFCKALGVELGLTFEIIEYSEHSLEYSSRSRAITYVEISGRGGGKQYGAGVSSSISKSSLRAVVSAVNKML